MFLKKRKIKILEKSKNKINRILQEGNFVELSYL